MLGFSQWQIPKGVVFEDIENIVNAWCGAEIEVLSY
jgi:hypothetical protein